MTHPVKTSGRCFPRLTISLFKDALFRGHEFHYATIETASEGDTPFAFVQDAHGGAEQAEGNRRGKVTGSFFHVIAAEDL